MSLQPLLVHYPKSGDEYVIWHESTEVKAAMYVLLPKNYGLVFFLYISNPGSTAHQTPDAGL